MLYSEQHNGSGFGNEGAIWMEVGQWTTPLIRHFGIIQYFGTTPAVIIVISHSQRGAVCLDVLPL